VKVVTNTTVTYNLHFAPEDVLIRLSLYIKVGCTRNTTSAPLAGSATHLNELGKRIVPFLTNDAFIRGI